MPLFANILLLILGFVLLVKGADWLVDGAAAFARKLKISDLAIGLTVVAFGTSMPELVVNIAASVDGFDHIILGNIIGSNNFNLFFTLGLAGLIAPLVVRSSTVWREIPLSMLAIVLLFLFATLVTPSGSMLISRLEGAIMLVVFGLFLAYVALQLKADSSQEGVLIRNLSVPKASAFLLLGLAGLILGGKLVVTHAVTLAEELGISQKIIGLTIVAMGTSLPELVTSVVAVIKKNTDIAVGNVIGSNIFNIVLILAISALIKPVGYALTFNTDIYLLAGGTIFLFIAMFTGQKKKLDRWEAGILFAVYIAYTIYLVVQ
ncbi:MAG: calcium/sodium antiporter [Candidatus Marinimicrobia bacterium]|nr:calcium/sodium antiporter [Candidatus Neomarinimicrobiota bacterium]